MKSSIYKALAQLQDEEGEFLFEYDDYSSDMEETIIKENLINICNGDYIKVTKPLRTNWELGAVHYILRKFIIPF